MEALFTASQVECHRPASVDGDAQLGHDRALHRPHRLAIGILDVIVAEQMQGAVQDVERDLLIDRPTTLRRNASGNPETDRQIAEADQAARRIRSPVGKAHHVGRCRITEVLTVEPGAFRVIHHQHAQAALAQAILGQGEIDRLLR